jgi:hypothetical protein|tara:strand:- start:351 stop:515 length:165 start_codon:yes stop_codon:yes gene_type:complete
MNDMTLEQAFAAALIQTGEALPMDLAVKLMSQGVILDEFIKANLTNRESIAPDN